MHIGQELGLGCWRESTNGKHDGIDEAALVNSYEGGLEVDLVAFDAIGRECDLIDIHT